MLHTNSYFKVNFLGRLICNIDKYLKYVMPKISTLFMVHFLASPWYLILPLTGGWGLFLDSFTLFFFGCQSHRFFQIHSKCFHLFSIPSAVMDPCSAVGARVLKFTNELLNYYLLVSVLLHDLDIHCFYYCKNSL